MIYWEEYSGTYNNISDPTLPIEAADALHQHLRAGSRPLPERNDAINKNGIENR
jgi:hypothetical protein